MRVAGENTERVVINQGFKLSPRATNLALVILNVLFTRKFDNNFL